MTTVQPNWRPYREQDLLCIPKPAREDLLRKIKAILEVGDFTDRETRRLLVRWPDNTERVVGVPWIDRYKEWGKLYGRPGADKGHI